MIQYPVCFKEELVRLFAVSALKPGVVVEGDPARTFHGVVKYEVFALCGVLQLFHAHHGHIVEILGILLHIAIDLLVQFLYISVEVGLLRSVVEGYLASASVFGDVEENADVWAGLMPFLPFVVADGSLFVYP